MHFSDRYRGSFLNCRAKENNEVVRRCELFTARPALVQRERVSDAGGFLEAELQRFTDRSAVVCGG